MRDALPSQGLQNQYIIGQDVTEKKKGRELGFGGDKTIGIDVVMRNGAINKIHKKGGILTKMVLAHKSSDRVEERKMR